MELIRLPQMRLAQLQNATERILDITQPIEVIADQVDAVSAAFTVFKQGMIKEQAISDKKTLDRNRDNLNSGLFKSVVAEELFPHEEPVKGLLNEVVKITGKYGYAINYLPYDEETAQVDNMLAELTALDLTPLPAIQRWIPLIAEANNTFKASSQNFLDQQATSSSISSATLLAKPLEDALNQLFTLLFAHIQISQAADLISVYKKLNILIEEYR